MTDIRCNEWADLTFHDPAEVLMSLRELEIATAHAEMDERVRTLRTNKLKALREGRDAAIFAYGMSVAVLETPVYYSRHEASDYDSVFRWSQHGTDQFCPVQLKELPPERTGSRLDLDGLMQKLTKYNSAELVVAVKLNRRCKMDLSQLRVPQLSIRELWFFWAGRRDQSMWQMYGDVLGSPCLFDFEYPTRGISRPRGDGAA